MELKIETTFPYSYQTNDLVFVDGKKAEDGKYYLSKWKSINVVEGKISEDTSDIFYEFGIEFKHRDLFLLLILIGIFFSIYMAFGVYFLEERFFYFKIIFLVATVLNLWGAYYILYDFYLFKIRVEKEYIYIGGRKHPRVIPKSEITGFYFFEIMPYAENVNGLSIILESGEQVLLDLDIYDEKIDELTSFLKNNFPNLSKKNQRKYNSQRKATYYTRQREPVVKKFKMVDSIITLLNTRKREVDFQFYQTFFADKFILFGYLVVSIVAFLYSLNSKEYFFPLVHCYFTLMFLFIYAVENFKIKISKYRKRGQ